MAGNSRFSMDENDIVRFLHTTIASFIQQRLIDKEQRAQQKEQCAERLAAEDEKTEVRYSDQAVLANLDWGMDALEEAINTSNVETKLARLDHAEKMLQVCAMLNSTQKTAGVPNFYLSAWAHLNLSYLCELRSNVQMAVHHVLEMFCVDPLFSRIDFAPDLWKTLFLPHMSSIVGWYTEERQKIIMDVIPDSADLSFTADFDQYFNDSLIFSVRPDQAEKMQNLEQVYGQALDENTKLYAKYYKDCINFDSTTSKKVMPMMPIAEPPMTPLHEVSRSIPDHVKFGPVLPKTAGFDPTTMVKNSSINALRLKSSSASSKDLEDTANWDPEGIPEEEEDDEEYISENRPNVYVGSEDRRNKILSDSGIKYNPEIGSKSSILKHSHAVFTSVGSPETPTPNKSSPKAEFHPKNSTSVLRLLSSRAMDAKVIATASPFPHFHPDPGTSSGDSDNEMQDHPRSVRTNHTRSISYGNVNSQLLEKSFTNDGEDGSQSYISLPSSEKMTPHSRVPKDFVCPITGQIFYDPVTLETGQTYERKAIHEWVKRGNTTCPITRQPISANPLPKTNYVLKRLITSWKEQHPDLAQELSYSETPRSSFSAPSKEAQSETIPSRTINLRDQRNRDDVNHHKPRRFLQAAMLNSPTSVISQAAVETIINGLNPYISCLCTSENLKECEASVLKVARTWKDSRGDPGLHAYLSNPTILNGFVDILSASLNREVLRTSIYVLAELICPDDRVGQILTADSDFEILASLLINGLAEAAVLIYLLKPDISQLSPYNFLPSLIQIISNKTEDSNDLDLLVDPKDAAIALLEQVVLGEDENSRTINAMNIISENGIPALINCLNREDGRHSIVFILLQCIHADNNCRNMIASRIELSPVLELFYAGNDSVRGICIEFLSELVQLRRRTLSNKILQIIKEEGAFSTMHTLLVYLQMAPMEQQPSIAILLLQLDLLVEPRKMSIYREEAIEALIEGLRRKEFLNSQITALSALSSLPGRLTMSGKSYVEVWLLKSAGFDKPYNALIKAEKIKFCDAEMTETMEEEEKTVVSWERRVAFVLCNHEKGIIFKALEECLKSNSIEITKSCLVIATWLIYMLYSLPDTGVRDAARKCLLDQFINILQSSKNLEDKILVTLALSCFTSDPGVACELGVYAKCMYKTLRKLKRNSVVVNDILKTLMNLPSVDAAEMWCCSEGPELNSSMNGEVLALLYIKGRVISSHSDGTIKVWDVTKRVPRLIQEVREHTKAVTCLYMPFSGDKLYSGSLDKTIRVWTMKQEEIHCVQVHDVKEAVLELVANNSYACFSLQGTGVKVYNWSGVPKHINFNKTVKCLAMMGDKLYCGCTAFSIQEVDLQKHSSTIFYSGARKLLGKQIVQSLHVHDNLLFAGGSSVDGIAGKVFSLSTKAVIGSLTTGLDIHCITVNNDFIFTATKFGTIEVWLKERFTKVGSIKIGNGGHAKITSLTSDKDGQMLFSGSSDGKIQAWQLD